MADSPNHGLNYYAIGDENWTHTPDMQTVEELLPITFDERANRSQYEPHQGAIFWAQDTGEVSRGTGAQWVDGEADFGALYEAGDRVATRNYVDTEIDGIDAGGGSGMEIHNNDYHDPNFATEGQLASHNNDTEAHGAGESGIASNEDVSASMTAHEDEYDHSLIGSGDGGVTEEYVDDEISTQISLHANITDAHHSRYSDNEARSAVDNSNVTVSHAITSDEATDADDSFLWNGYELVVDDETPTTNQYIRLESE